MNFFLLLSPDMGFLSLMSPAFCAEAERNNFESMREWMFMERWGQMFFVPDVPELKRQDVPDVPEAKMRNWQDIRH